jgi:hypothetical protein
VCLVSQPVSNPTAAFAALDSTIVLLRQLQKRDGLIMRCGDGTAHMVIVICSMALHGMAAGCVAYAAA